MLDDSDRRIRLGAATVLLDRGFGRPNQNVTATGGDGTLTLHLLAAQTIGRELLNGTVIDGQLSSDTQGDETETKTLDQTLPSE